MSRFSGLRRSVGNFWGVYNSIGERIITSGRYLLQDAAGAAANIGGGASGVYHAHKRGFKLGCTAVAVFVVPAVLAAGAYFWQSSAVTPTVPAAAYTATASATSTATATMQPVSATPALEVLTAAPAAGGIAGIVANTPTHSATVTRTPAASYTATGTATPTSAASATAAGTYAPSATASRTSVPSVTATSTVAPTRTAAPTATGTPAPALTPVPDVYNPIKDDRCVVPYDSVVRNKPNLDAIAGILAEGKTRSVAGLVGVKKADILAALMRYYDGNSGNGEATSFELDYEPVPNAATGSVLLKFALKGVDYQLSVERIPNNSMVKLGELLGCKCYSCR